MQRIRQLAKRLITGAAARMKPTERAVELLSGEIATEHDMRDAIADMIARHGTQAAVAREIGVSQAHLHDIMVGKRSVGGRVAEKLGWEKVRVFRKREA